MDLTTITGIKEDLLGNKLTQAQIGDKWGVSRSTVSDIATNRRYQEIEPLLVPNRIPGGQVKHLNLETQNVALIGMVENLRQERNLLKRQLKAASKRISVVDELAERLAPTVNPVPAIPKPKLGKSKKIDETLVLVLSDVHADQVVTPGEVDGLEEFNFPICVRRAEVLIQSLLKFTQESLTNFRFKKLIIMGLGDYTSGIIHDHVKRSFFRDQFVNDLAIAELFSQMFSELAHFFEEIHVINIIGNHGRLTEKCELTKDAVIANHDTLIMKIAEIHCQNLKHVKFHFPEGLSSIHNIEGWNFYMHHGHAKKGSSETWTRAKRKSQTIVPLHKGNVHYLVSGHFHTPGDVSVSGGATLIGNGAFLGCDPYSYHGIDEANEPSQLIFGVHKDHGVTWRLPIRLRTPDEKSGPQRYRISYLEGA